MALVPFLTAVRTTDTTGSGRARTTADREKRSSGRGTGKAVRSQEALAKLRLPCPTLPYIALLCLTLPYIALHCPTLPYFALHCPTLPYIALHCPTLPYFALHCPTSMPYVCATTARRRVVLYREAQYSTLCPPQHIPSQGIVRVNHSSNHIKVACISNTLTHPPLIWEISTIPQSSAQGNRKPQRAEHPRHPTLRIVPRPSCPNVRVHT